jgi:hypothetical protein
MSTVSYEIFTEATTSQSCTMSSFIPVLSIYGVYH